MALLLMAAAGPVANWYLSSNYVSRSEWQASVKERNEAIAATARAASDGFRENNSDHKGLLSIVTATKEQVTALAERTDSLIKRFDRHEEQSTKN